MASSQVVIMTTMAVLLAVVSAAHAAEAPAPSPTSPASVISPSFAVGFLTAAVALVTIINDASGLGHQNFGSKNKLYSMFELSGIES
ncbi:hypothetical protein E2542_SST03694 [Spatholobus suberectus]|nr:hypothetical protein E2542_SST03694 [Spatholobus suberectus]